MQDIPRQGDILMRDERKPSKAVIKKLMDTIPLCDGLLKLAHKQMVVSGYPLVPNDDKVLDKYLTEDDIVEAVRDGYAMYFNMDDILCLISFFKSDAGKKFFSSQGSMTKDILTKTQEKAHQAAARIIKDMMQNQDSTEQA